VAQIVVLENGAEVRRLALTGTPVTVGRGPDNTLTLPDTRLSRNHCRVLPDGHGGWRVVDLGSSNGTRVGGRRVQDAPLAHDTRVDVGRFTLVFQDPARPEAAAAPPPRPAGAPPSPPAGARGCRLVARGERENDRVLPLAGPLRIGRGEGNDLRLDYEEVSGSHARVVPARGGFRLEDPGSTNGTFVNGNRVRNHALEHGDEIEIGPVRLLFLSAGGDEEAALAAFRRRRMARERRWALVAEDGEQTEIESLPFTIGRAADNRFPLDDESVSTHHARLVQEGSRLVLEDLDSTNGTWLGGRRVSRERVGHGDEIEFGRFLFVLRDVEYPLVARRPEPRAWGWAVAVGLLVLVAAAGLLLPSWLAPRGEEGEGAGPGQDRNLLKVNASFETPLAANGSLPGWDLVGKAFTLDRKESFRGQASLQVALEPSGGEPSAAEARCTQEIPVEGGRTYTASCRLRVRYSPGIAGIRIDWGRGKGAEALPFDREYGDLVTGDTVWLGVETPLTAPPGARTARLSLVALGSGGTHWFDDVRLVEEPAGSRGSLRRLEAEKLGVWLNRRGLAAVAAGPALTLKNLGLVFWDKRRATKGDQESSLPAAGYPRFSATDFSVRAEAVKVSEGLSVPFEVKWTSAPSGIRAVYRCHADAGHLAAGDRVVLALGVEDGVSSVLLDAKAGEIEKGKAAFGTVPDVRQVRFRTGAEEIVLALDPPMSLSGLVDASRRLRLFASTLVDRADLGKVLEMSATLSLVPDRQEARAQELLKRADEQLGQGRLGKAEGLYRKVRAEYGDVEEAARKAEARAQAIGQKARERRSALEKDLVELEAAPSAEALSAFLFRVEEFRAVFDGMKEAEEAEALGERARLAYGRVGGKAFEEARRALAEAAMAFEVGDWVRAEAGLQSLLSESKDEALAPQAQALLAEIKRRQEDAEEREAWVEERLREARDLEGRGERETAREVYRSILLRYPRGEWVSFVEEQIQKLGKG
jgi:pSer/pThr/pTyr-binding forkhead associated (FHA) protein